MTVSEGALVESYPEPLRLGFFLARQGVTCTTWPELAYRGVDRLPYLPTLEEMRQLRVARPRLAEAWDAYWEAKDSKQLNVDPSVVREVKDMFVLAGWPKLEIVFAEIARFAEQERSRSYYASVLEPWIPLHRRLSAAPQASRLLGYDLSYPVPSFHSAIYQPAIPNGPDLRTSLNDAGLVSELGAATRLLRLLNELTQRGPPFVAIAVWEVS